jgi:hypothetical protein
LDLISTPLGTTLRLAFLAVAMGQQQATLCRSECAAADVSTDAWANMEDA